eukprot:CAMPEP_0116012604 /NCGR_PEP_ID=MMETSP0321-20121206/5220_1 /TAXON_ID=163516 /ORGANISM="Leptocylindrus danicus var. danicus, Strain B650" /LENGTH=145 /DNA_ID=CAMNT_0003481975 /DNA_START=321 /DNA_END=755 /DNA_ORIENTATION=-
MQNLSVEAVRSVQREKQREQINRDDNKPDQGGLLSEANEKGTCAKRKQIDEVQENEGESVEAVRSVQREKQRRQINRDNNKPDQRDLLSQSDKKKTREGNQTTGCARESVKLVTMPGCCDGQTLKEHLASCEAGRNSLAPLDDLW